MPLDVDANTLTCEPPSVCVCLCLYMYGLSLLMQVPRLCSSLVNEKPAAGQECSVHDDKVCFIRVGREGGRQAHTAATSVLWVSPAGQGLERLFVAMLCHAFLKCDIACDTACRRRFQVLCNHSRPRLTTLVDALLYTLNSTRHL